MEITKQIRVIVLLIAVESQVSSGVSGWEGVPHQKIYRIYGNYQHAGHPTLLFSRFTYVLD